MEENKKSTQVNESVKVNKNNLLNLEKTQDTFSLLDYCRQILEKAHEENWVQKRGVDAKNLQSLTDQFQEVDNKFRELVFDSKTDEKELDKIISKVKNLSNKVDEEIDKGYLVEKQRYIDNTSQQLESQLKEIHDRKIQLLRTESDFKARVGQLEMLFKSRMTMLEQDYQTKLNIDSTVFASNHFLESAIQFERHSSKWLDRIQIVLIWIFVFLFISFISIFINVPLATYFPFLKNPSLLELNLIRGSVAFVLFWLLAFCTFQYYKNRNLADTYHQRSSLFNIYPALIKSVQDKNIMDKMLADISRSLFATR